MIIFQFSRNERAFFLDCTNQQCRLLCCLRLLWLLGWTLCLQGIAAFWADGLAAGQWVAALQAS